MKIIVLSRNPKLYSTKRIMEAGNQRNHEIQIVDPAKCDLFIEKGKHRIYYKGNELSEIDAIIPRIGASITFYGAAVVRQFEMMGVFSTLQSLALVRSRDKFTSLQVLSREGLGMPKTAFTNNSEDVGKLIDRVGGAPCVIKLLEGTQGVGVVLAETKNAAESVLEAFHGLKARVIVQQFIPEAKGADIRAFVVDGEVVGAMKRQGKEGEFRSNLHKGGSATVYQLNAEEEDAALRAASSLGLGVCGVDMILSNSGPMILEVNSSPGLEGIETATKVDIADKIICYIERNA